VHITPQPAGLQSMPRRWLALTATMPSLGPFSQASSMSSGGLPARQKRRRHADRQPEAGEDAHSPPQHLVTSPPLTLTAVIACLCSCRPLHALCSWLTCRARCRAGCSRPAGNPTRVERRAPLFASQGSAACPCAPERQALERDQPVWHRVQCRCGSADADGTASSRCTPCSPTAKAAAQARSRI
jgi:hypothetical protein